MNNQNKYASIFRKNDNKNLDMKLLNDRKSSKYNQFKVKILKQRYSDEQIDKVKDHSVFKEFFSI